MDFDDEGMEEAECVMTKRTGETSCDFSAYMDDLHTYFFVVRATPKVSEQAYVKAGSWVGSPDADYRAAQVIGYTDGKWRNYLEGSRYQLEDGRKESSERGKAMRHKLKVSVSKEPKTGGIAAVREVSVRERLLRLLLGEMRRVIVLIPGDKVDEIAISEEGKTDERTENEG